MWKQAQIQEHANRPEMDVNWCKDMFLLRLPFTAATAHVAVDD